MPKYKIKTKYLTNQNPNMSYKNNISLPKNQKNTKQINLLKQTQTKKKKNPTPTNTRSNPKKLIQINRPIKTIFKLIQNKHHNPQQTKLKRITKRIKKPNKTNLKRARPTGLAQKKDKKRHNKSKISTLNKSQHINSNNTTLIQKEEEEETNNIRTLKSHKRKTPYFKKYLTYLPIQYKNKKTNTKIHTNIHSITPLKSSKNQDYNPNQINTHINHKNIKKRIITPSKNFNQAWHTNLTQYQVKNNNRIKNMPLYSNKNKKKKKHIKPKPIQKEKTINKRKPIIKRTQLNSYLC